MSADTIVRVDPAKLLIGANVRKDAVLTAEFKASIKELGVRVPITAYESADGLVVVDGQRRTLAAVDMKAKTVPVYVTEAPTDADRIIDQVVVNEQRSEISHREAVAAVQELALFDMKTPAIVKRTGLDERLVDGAIKIGGSPAARAALEAEQLDFDAAIAVADFEGEPEQAELIEMAKSNRWSIPSRARQIRDEQQLAKLRGQIEEMGLILIKEPDPWTTDDPKSIERLYVDKAMKEQLSELPHEKVVELAGDGLRAFTAMDYVDGERQATIGYAIAGWEVRGLFGRKSASGSNTTKPTTPEEIEAAKLERRAARETTKEWVEATALRIEWLQALVKRKTPPKGWEPLAVGRLLADVSNDGWRMTLVILGEKDSRDMYGSRGAVAGVVSKTPTRAVQVAIAAWAGATEGGYDFPKKGWSQDVAKKYLLQLEAWGYVLSDVELVAAGKKRKAAAAA